MGTGYIHFRAPDQAAYCVSKLKEFDPTKKDYVVKSDKDALDHWLCDGKSIFEYNLTKKQLIERRITAEMQGKAIADGPLPFIFGAKADQLKRRYWMRDVTPKEELGKQIWLEAFPKFQQDAANFQRATVILNEADFLPIGLEIVLPGSPGQRETTKCWRARSIYSARIGQQPARRARIPPAEALGLRSSPWVGSTLLRRASKRRTSHPRVPRPRQSGLRPAAQVVSASIDPVVAWRWFPGRGRPPRVELPASDGSLTLLALRYNQAKRQRARHLERARQTFRGI